MVLPREPVIVSAAQRKKQCSVPKPQESPATRTPERWSAELHLALPRGSFTPRLSRAAFGMPPRSNLYPKVQSSHCHLPPAPCPSPLRENLRFLFSDRSQAFPWNRSFQIPTGPPAKCGARVTSEASPGVSYFPTPRKQVGIYSWKLTCLRVSKRS